jgi:hypothetical protein
MVTAEDKDISSTTNTNNYNDRERKVLELYDDGKSTRDIAKELRMSLRDISTILRENQVNHGIVIVDNGSSNSNKSTYEKSIQAYKLYDEGKKRVEVAIQLGLSENEATLKIADTFQVLRQLSTQRAYFLYNAASSGESSADNTQIRLKDGTLKLLPLIPIYYPCKHEIFLTTSVVIFCYEPKQSADHSRDSHI